jgi:hypothetical protein
MDLEVTVENVDESLGRRWAKRPAGSELRCHLRKARSELRRDMHDEVDIRRAGQRRADECVRRLQQVIRLQAAPG